MYRNTMYLHGAFPKRSLAFAGVSRDFYAHGHRQTWIDPIMSRTCVMKCAIRILTDITPCAYRRPEQCARGPPACPTPGKLDDLPPASFSHPRGDAARL